MWGVYKLAMQTLRRPRLLQHSSKMFLRDLLLLVAFEDFGQSTNEYEIGVWVNLMCSRIQQGWKEYFHNSKFCLVKKKHKIVLFSVSTFPKGHWIAELHTERWWFMVQRTIELTWQRAQRPLESGDNDVESTQKAELLQTQKDCKHICVSFALY